MDTTQHNTISAGTAQPKYGLLLKENVQLRKQLKQALQQIVDLTGRFEKLQQENEKLRLQLDKLQKAGKRQAAPFRKQEEPAKPPRKPGRKRGRRHGRHAHRSVPPRIDETYDVPLPKACPHCGGKHISETEISPQYQTEIPRAVIYRRFDVHVGDCKTCHRKVRGRHALQTSTAAGAAASQLGQLHRAATSRGM